MGGSLVMIVEIWIKIVNKRLKWQALIHIETSHLVGTLAKVDITHICKFHLLLHG